VSEKYDPFGRPIEGEHPWAKPAEEEGGLPGGFLPPEPATATSAPAPVAPERPEAPSSAPAEWPPLPSAAPAGRSAPPASGGPVPIPGAPPDEALASWGRRVVAHLVDGLVVVVVAFLLGFAVALIARSGQSGDRVGDLAGTIAAISLLPLWLVYATAMLATTNGRTIGKALCRIRVVGEHGAPMTWGRAALRDIVMRGLVITVIGTITLGIAGILDVLWPLWDKQNRSLHDHGADTWVVRAS
jgi:uncharacterized RDD family membrane protein YckC